MSKESNQYNFSILIAVILAIQFSVPIALAKDKEDPNAQFKKKVNRQYQLYEAKYVSHQYKNKSEKEIAQINEKAKQYSLASFYYKQAAFKFLQQGNLDESKICLNKVLELSDHLPTNQNVATANTMLSYAFAFRKNKNKESKYLFLDTAQKLVQRQKLKNSNLLLSIQKSYRSLNKDNKDIESLITDSKEILSLSLLQKPLQRDTTYQEYLNLIDLYIKAGKTRSAKSTIRKAYRFHKTEFGKDDITLLKLLLKKFKLAKSPSAVKKVEAQMEQLIVEYVPSQSYIRALIIDNRSAVKTQRYLLSSVEKSTAKLQEQPNQFKLDKTIKLAKLTYLMSTRLSGFDRSSFGSLVAVLKLGQKNSLLNDLYQSTIQRLNNSSNKNDLSYAKNLESSYKRFLKKNKQTN